MSIRIKKKVCAGWDGNSHPAFIFKRIDGKGYCSACSQRLSKADKPDIKNTEELHQVMHDWWLKQPKKCGNCGYDTPKQFSVMNVHHLLPKAKFRDIQLNSLYFMLLCNDCHGSFELSPNRIKHMFIYRNMENAKIHYNNKNK